MTSTTPTTTTTVRVPSGWEDPMSRTAEEWRAKATGANIERAESWERSDTDGFLSQWASGQMAHRYFTLATLAENGGMAEMCTLTDLEGNELDARQIDGKYGPSWMIRTPGQPTRYFNESKAQDPERAAAANRKKGYVLTYPMTRVVMNRSGHLVRASELD